jgi:hypothetical protein
MSATTNVIAIAAIVIAVVALFLVFGHVIGQSKSTVAGGKTLFQPRPPTGISVVSGNIIWYYDNSTSTVVVLNATPNCTIGVTKGQSIKFSMQQPYGVLYKGEAANGAASIPYNGLYKVPLTGNLSIVRLITNPT